MVLCEYLLTALRNIATLKMLQHDVMRLCIGLIGESALLIGTILGGFNPSTIFMVTIYMSTLKPTVSKSRDLVKCCVVDLSAFEVAIAPEFRSLS